MTASRPLANRVDPFGELCATSARGDLMGNRGGKLHDTERRLGRRRWTNRTWIACICDFKNRQRDVWGEGYTELFFLDEVTAFAAGHRPCFECRRAEALAFQEAFSPGAPLKALEMDARLHDERLDGALKRRHARDWASLPDGAMVALDGAAFALRGAALLPWSFEGYGAPRERPRAGLADALTPPSILAVLARGYRPRWRADASA